MDIYTDYGNWKFENHEFISELVKNKSKTISRFTPVIAVVDYLYDKVCQNKKLTSDEEVFFSTGFDYIYDQFLFIKTLYEVKFNNDYKELDKYSQTINLLLYINEFQAEALNYTNLPQNDLKMLDDLEKRVHKHLDNKENAPDEYFLLLDEIVDNIFSYYGIELVLIDQIFNEVALEYQIFNEEDDFDIYNMIINKQIEKTRNK